LAMEYLRYPSAFCGRKPNSKNHIPKIGLNSLKWPFWGYGPAFFLGGMGDSADSVSQRETRVSRKKRCADNGLADFGSCPLSCPTKITLKSPTFPIPPKRQNWRIFAFFRVF